MGTWGTGLYSGDFAADPDLFLLPFENVRTALLLRLTLRSSRAPQRL